MKHHVENNYTNLNQSSRSFLFGEEIMTVSNNPLSPSVEFTLHLHDQNFDFKIRREHQKISYGRRSYESIDVIGVYFGLHPIARFTESSTPGLKEIYKIF